MASRWILPMHGGVSLFHGAALRAIQTASDGGLSFTMRFTVLEKRDEDER